MLWFYRVGLSTARMRHGIMSYREIQAARSDRKVNKPRCISYVTFEGFFVYVGVNSSANISGHNQLYNLARAISSFNYVFCLFSYFFKNFGVPLCFKRQKLRLTCKFLLLLLSLLERRQRRGLSTFN